MYSYHFERAGGDPNAGWLRSMWYGVGQQAIRQNLGYWLLQVALRPDRNPRLVSYPAYAAKAGQAPAVRQVYLNLKDLSSKLVVQTRSKGRSHCRYNGGRMLLFSSRRHPNRECICQSNRPRGTKGHKGPKKSLVHGWAGTRSILYRGDMETTFIYIRKC